MLDKHATKSQANHQKNSPLEYPYYNTNLDREQKTIKTIVDVDFQGILDHIITPPKTFAKLHQVNRNKTTPIKKTLHKKILGPK